MQMSGSVRRVVSGNAAETSGIEDLGRKREMGEKGRQQVHFDTLRYHNGILSDLKYQKQRHHGLVKLETEDFTESRQ